MRIRTKSTDRRRAERGSALVELALCFLVFLLLSFGTLDFAWAVYAYNSCSYLAQDAARWSSVNGSLSPTPATAASVTSYVQNEAVGLTSSLLTVNTTWTPNNTPGSVVQVTVGYTLVPLIGLAMKQNIPISSTAQFYINH